MKNKLFAVLLALMATGAAAAQDTLSYTLPYGPENNYFCGFWVPTGDTTYGLVYMSSALLHKSEAFPMETPKGDSLVIYGIAASMSTMQIMAPEDASYFMDNIDDQSYTDVYDYLRLFEADSNSPYPQPIGEKLKVHIKTTPISYYLNTGLLSHRPGEIIPILPVYERYFSEPIVVYDSFYLGREFHSGRHLGGGVRSCWPVCIMAFGDPYNFHLRHLLYGPAYLNDTTSIWSLAEPSHIGEPYMPLLFAILTPNLNGDDDTIPSVDTLSIGSASLLDRLTGVMPNPATCSAKVVSSLGLREVAVYNAAGDLVHRQQADGLSTTLDTRPWPAGTYMLRITTPAGTATKKLVVTR